VVAGGINFERDLDDVWVADVPDTHVLCIAAAQADEDNGPESNGGNDS
jgi:hypothetical protein